MKIYLYPFVDQETKKVMNSDNLKVHPRMKELYKFFKYNGKVVDIENYNEEILNIFSRKVLAMLNAQEEGWEDMLPNGIAELIKDHRLFGYTRRRISQKK